ncbi:hypothetical protein CKO38_14890 [Rhodospirillum rubrum]|uniref:hypothetical protein n=1 Tax=Rhodospirillum rubrum TaxID=1085 RepID=UPI001905F13D|nr:hypothetical protein [Rhodospirillum rubrum]MBK1665807.1 hypothetical protein [Rhodospirillum rubrum]MBK1677934.1 hypothetical protein [Rhodospirillum rubrum]
MPIRTSKTTITIEGACTVEDALPLLEALQATPKAKVALKTCTHLHSAALQVLLALRPTILSLPEEPFLARWIAPALKADGR